MIIEKNACPCAYCDYFKPFEYEERNHTIQTGICLKKDIMREPWEILCEDFILKAGVYTQKWYPNKPSNEQRLSFSLPLDGEGGVRAAKSRANDG